MLVPGIWLAVVFAAAIDVEGDVACPAPSAVAAKLRPLLGVTAPVGDRVRLTTLGNTLVIAMVRADGRPAGVRHIGLDHDCDELAEATAIIVATWQQAPPSVAATRPPTPASAATLSLAVASVAQAPPGDRGFGVAVGAGGEVAGGLVPALAIEATWGRPAGWAGHARAWMAGRHRQALSRGEAFWRRAGVSVGPAFALALGSVAGEIDGGLALAYLGVSGGGFAANESHAAIDVGAATGLRLRWRVPGRPFLGLATSWFPRRTFAVESAAAANAPAISDAGAPLPRWQWLATAGFGFGR